MATTLVPIEEATQYGALAIEGNTITGLVEKSPEPPSGYISIGGVIFNVGEIRPFIDDEVAAKSPSGQEASVAVALSAMFADGARGTPVYFGGNEQIPRYARFDVGDIDGRADAIEYLRRVSKHKAMRALAPRLTRAVMAGELNLDLPEDPDGL